MYIYIYPPISYIPWRKPTFYLSVQMVRVMDFNKVDGFVQYLVRKCTFYLYKLQTSHEVQLREHIWHKSSVVYFMVNSRIFIISCCHLIV